MAGIRRRILPVHRLPVSESAVAQGLPRLRVAKQNLPLHGFGRHSQPPQLLIRKCSDIDRPLQRRGPAPDNVACQTISAGRHDLVFRKLNGGQPEAEIILRAAQPVRRDQKLVEVVPVGLLLPLELRREI